MVLSTKVGKQRPYWRGLLLTVISFGLYGVYWNYKAHDEVFEQFELKKEGRDEGVVWYILGFVFFPLQFVYYWMFVGNVRYVRQRLALKEGISPGGFLGIYIGGFFVYLASFVVFFVTVAVAGETATSEAEAMAAMMGGLLIIGLGVLALLGFMALAYYFLQRDINGVWDAFDTRIEQMRQAAAPPPAEPRPLEPSFQTDLAPPSPTDDAPRDGHALHRSGHPEERTLRRSY